MSRLRDLCRNESGYALVATAGVLVVLIVLGGVVLRGAVHASGSTHRDVASKRALAAAEAGLQVARYRLNMTVPHRSKCLAATAVAPGTAPAAAGGCPPATGNADGGATYAYYVTPELAPGSACAGGTVPAAATGVVWRCVTSIGTAAGETRRIQAQVRAIVGVPLFGDGGIVGEEEVAINQNGFGNIVGDVGSNGEIKLKSCRDSGSNVRWNPGPSATIDNECSGTFTNGPPRTEPWALEGIDGLIGNPNTALPANNDNDEVFPQPGFSYSYDPGRGTRELKDTEDATLTLDGPNPRAGSDGVWTFNFCTFRMTKKTSFVLTNGAVARFYIDASTRAGSSCDGLGKLTLTNVSGINWDLATDTPGNPAALQFMVVDDAEVHVSNKSGFAAALYAPRAEVEFTNKTKWNGAISGRAVSVTNGLDFNAGDVSAITTPKKAHYERQRWAECRRRAANPAYPEAGC